MDEARQMALDYLRTARELFTKMDRAVHGGVKSWDGRARAYEAWLDAVREFRKVTT